MFRFGHNNNSFKTNITEIGWIKLTLKIVIILFSLFLLIIGIFCIIYLIVFYVDANNLSKLNFVLVLFNIDPAFVKDICTFVFVDLTFKNFIIAIILFFIFIWFFYGSSIRQTQIYLKMCYILRANIIVEKSSRVFMFLLLIVKRICGLFKKIQIKFLYWWYPLFKRHSYFGYFNSHQNKNSEINQLNNKNKKY